MNLPDWTAFTSDETDHRGLDPLGLQSVGASIVQRRLLPGITDSTIHIRYYSFFCWVFWTFWQGGKKKAGTLEQLKWRTRLENVLRTATLWKSPDLLGLVGTTKTIKIDGLSRAGKVRIDKADVISAFIPAFYSASFRALGCGKWTPDGGAQLTTFGKTLAMKFDTTMRQSAVSRNALPALLSNNPTVSVKDVKAVADSIGLRPVEPGEPEYESLLELLFRLKAGDEQLTWQSRSRSLGLLMEIAKQGQGRILSVKDVHSVFATGLLPNKSSFNVPSEVRSDFEIWKRYQERQYLKIAIYSLWYEVVRFLDFSVSKTADARDIAGYFRNSFERSRVARKWFGHDFTGLSIHQAQGLLSKRLRGRPEELGKAAIVLNNELLNIRWTSSERISTSLVLLLLVATYWKEFQGQIEESQLHREGGRLRIALDSVVRDANQMGNSSLPDYLQWLVENYVLKQSTRIALEKLPDYRYFLVRDDAGFRLVKKQDPRSYLAYDPSRIGSAFELMSELKLVDISNGYRLTENGRRVLDQLRTLHHNKLA